MNSARRGRGRSLVWPVASMILLATIAGGVAQLLIATAVLRPLELRDVRARGEIALSLLQRSVSALPAAPDSAVLQPILDRLHRENELRAALLVRLPGGGLVWDRPEFASFALALANRRTGGAETGGFDTIASRTLTQGGRVIGEALVVRPRSTRRGPRLPSTEALLLSLPVALLTALPTAFLLVRWLVRRLRRLERLAERVEGGDLTARIEDTGGDEIGRLAERLNNMTGALAAARARLEAQDAQRRQLFADITHELATPLTSVRGYTETLVDPAVQVSEAERERYLAGILEESRRLDRLIHDLFELARLEAGASPLESERLDWAALCGNVVERFAPRFKAAGLTLRWEPAAGEAWVMADGHRIVQVLENLLANSMRHVPPGSTVQVSVTVASPAAGAGGATRAAEGTGDAGTAVSRGFRLTVADDGPGVPEADLSHLFERFYRSAIARRSEAGAEAGGSGLGLAIVSEITLRHGGSVRARAVTPHGLAIDVDLPAAG